MDRVAGPGPIEVLIIGRAESDGEELLEPFGPAPRCARVAVLTDRSALELRNGTMTVGPDHLHRTPAADAWEVDT